MKVKDVMTKDIIAVDKDINLKHVLNLMKKHEITKLPVLENKKLVGIITDNIIAYKLGSIRKKGIPASRLHASSVTDKNFECVHPETDIEKILEKVGEPGPTMLCVTENTSLLGIITKADLLPLVKSKKKLSEIASKNILTVSSDDRVVHARRIMVDENIARLPVIKDGKLVGIISDNEIAFAFANIKRSFPIGRQKHQLEELLVEDVMKKPVIWTQPSISVSEAASIMMKNNLGALPLIENEKLIGIVSRTDLLKTISL